MASITPYQTEAGRRWRVRYRKPDRTQTDKRGFRTKRDAEVFAATVEVSKTTGTYIDPSRGRATISSLGEAWLQAFRGAPGTISSYTSTWQLHVRPEFGHAAVADVGYEWVRDWVARLAKQRGSSTVRRAHRILASILDEAVTAKRIPHNPARDINHLPSNKPRKNVYLTYAEVERLAVEAGKYKLAVYLIAYVGLRYGEIKGLRAADVDVQRRHITVERQILRDGSPSLPKSGKPRTVGFPAFMSPLIAAAVLESGGGYLIPVLPHPRALGWWGTARKRAGLRESLTFHDLRHSAASFAISEGAPVTVVQAMLGHASAKVTLDSYADLIPTDLDTVAERIEAARLQNVGSRWAKRSGG